jgi:hypothetical protein
MEDTANAKKSLDMKTFNLGFSLGFGVWDFCLTMTWISVKSVVSRLTAYFPIQNIANN